MNEEIRTVKLELKGAFEALLPTAQAYTDAFNHSCSKGFSQNLIRREPTSKK